MRKEGGTILLSSGFVIIYKPFIYLVGFWMAINIVLIVSRDYYIILDLGE